MAASSASLTPEQLRARERWQSRWNLPIILAAVVPLFVNSPDTRWVQVVVGLGSWIVFVVDLVVQRRIVPDYLHRRRGRIDLVLFRHHVSRPPHPGSVAARRSCCGRLTRVVRLLLVTAGVRRFAARLGKVALVAGSVVLIAYAGPAHSPLPLGLGDREKRAQHHAERARIPVSARTLLGHSPAALSSAPVIPRPRRAICSRTAASPRRLGPGASLVGRTGTHAGVL